MTCPFTVNEGAGRPRTSTAARAIVAGASIVAGSTTTTGPTPGWPQVIS
jgi:hypothetical protein